MKHRKGLLTGFALAIGLVAIQFVSPVLAQPGPGGGPGMGHGWSGPGPGMMMGPWAMGGGMMRNMCSPRGIGFAEWRTARIERLIKPTDEQKAKLEDFRKATEKAAESMRASCPADAPANPAARLEFMEKRIEAMHAAIKTVRPAFDAFYSSLTDEQKARFGGAGPRGGRGR